MMGALRHVEARHFVWASFVLVLTASTSHVAHDFAALESGWWAIVGILAAIAIESGIASMTWLAGRARQEHGGFTRLHLWIFIGLIVLAAISAVSNFTHALTVASGATSQNEVSWADFVGLDLYQRTRVILLSVTLPALTIIMVTVAEHSVAIGRKEEAPEAADAPAAPEAKRKTKKAPAKAGPRQKVTAALLLDYVNANPHSPPVEVASALDASVKTIGRRAKEAEISWDRVDGKWATA